MRLFLMTLDKFDLKKIDAFGQEIFFCHNPDN